jgi:Protein of unknown function (DUF3987)
LTDADTPDAVEPDNSSPLDDSYWDSLFETETSETDSVIVVDSVGPDWTGSGSHSRNELTPDTRNDHATEDAAPGATDITSGLRGSGLDGVPALPGTVFDGLSVEEWSASRQAEAGTVAGAWIDIYTSYADGIAPMTPTIFHESAALVLGSIAIARRLKVAMPHGDIFANLYVAWIAGSTLWHKSTALAIARRLAQDLFPHLLASHDTTPEALLSDLAGREPTGAENMTEEERAQWAMERHFAAQRGLILDEFSGLLVGAGKDYNGGLIEDLLLFYDNEPLHTRSTRIQGRLTIRNSSLSLLGASTPAALAPHLSQERLWGMGWFPRFALLSPDIERPPWRRAVHAEPPPELFRGLRDLYQRLPLPTWPEPPQARTVSLGRGVHADLERYSKAVSYDLIRPGLDHRLWATYGRLPTQALKIAIILAALDWKDDTAVPRIERHHMARAFVITEQWRASAHRVVATAAQSTRDQLAARVLGAIPDAGNGPSARDLSRSVGVGRDDLLQALKLLEQSGEVVRLKQPSGHKGGRPTERFLRAR